MVIILVTMVTLTTVISSRVKIYILLTKREGRTGRISARGLDSTDRAQRGPYKKDQGPIFSQLGARQIIEDFMQEGSLCMERPGFKGFPFHSS